MPSSHSGQDTGDDGPLATKEEYENGLTPFAHLYTNGGHHEECIPKVSATALLLFGFIDEGDDNA